MSYHLLPVGSGKDFLKIVEFNAIDAKTIILGRKFIKPGSENSRFVSENHLMLIIKSRCIYIKSCNRQNGMVYKNGSAVLQNEDVILDVGDKISFLGTIDWFNYQLQSGKYVFDMTQSTSCSPGETNEIATKSTSFDIISDDLTDAIYLKDKNKPNQSKDLLNMLECSICLGTTAYAHSICPCADTFCYSCVIDWAKKSNKCPNCSVEFDISQLLHNRVIDNLAFEIVKNSLSNEEAADFNLCVEKSKAMKTPVVIATAQAQASSRKRVRAVRSPVRPVARSGVAAVVDLTAAVM